MSVQKQLNSFLQAHRECKADNFRHYTYSDLAFLDYRSGLTDNDLNDCMKELSSIVHSPDFGGVEVAEDDLDYELIEDFEEI